MERSIPSGNAGRFAGAMRLMRALLVLKANSVNAAVAGQALATFIERKLPAMPGAGPEPSVGKPPLAEIPALMRTVAVDGIAGPTGLNDDALLPLLNFQQPAAEPIHVFWFHQEKPLHQRLIDVRLTIEANAKCKRKFLPCDNTIQNAGDLP